MTIATKKGAASFYIITFATLILMIIVVSFIRLIVSEMQKTTNADLAASAYDSALAGVEDAKVAILNYYSCKNQGYTASTKTQAYARVGNPTCSDIIYFMEQEGNASSEDGGCDSVAHMLGRAFDNNTGVVIEETNASTNLQDNSMLQAYTCVKVSRQLNDYRTTLSSANSTRVIPLRANTDDISNIKSIQISWYADSDSSELNFADENGFSSLSNTDAATPPTISAQLIQTSATFNLSDFDIDKNGQTDRGTIFLVPSATINNDISAVGSSSVFVKANDKVSKNTAYKVKCEKGTGKEFTCSTTIGLPNPVGGSRNAETFFLVISLPYGQPDADISVSMLGSNNEIYDFDGVQIAVDSTGRANDIYSRVYTRVEMSDIYFPYPDFAVQLGDSLIKNVDSNVNSF